MAIFLTVIITLLVVILLDFTLSKIFAPYIRKIIDTAIDVSCYVNTYHYDKDEYDRITIGRKRFYDSIFQGKETEFKKDLSDRVFWVFYTQILNKPLNAIPVKVNMHNNRCLAEGEERKTEKFLDDYQEEQQEEYKKYATESELRRNEEIANVENEA